jgi:hypothetical protein
MRTTSAGKNLLGLDTGRRFTEGEDNTWAVFPSGEAFTVTLRPLFRLTAVARRRLYGYVDESEGRAFVAAYAVRDPR